MPYCLKFHLIKQNFMQPAIFLEIIFFYSCLLNLSPITPSNFKDVGHFHGNCCHGNGYLNHIFYIKFTHLHISAKYEVIPIRGNTYTSICPMGESMLPSVFETFFSSEKAIVNISTIYTS